MSTSTLVTIKTIWTKSWRTVLVNILFFSAPIQSQVWRNCYPTRTKQNVEKSVLKQTFISSCWYCYYGKYMHVHKERTCDRIFTLEITVLHTRSQANRTYMSPEFLKHEPYNEQTSKISVAYFISTTGIYFDQSSASRANRLRFYLCVPKKATNSPKKWPSTQHTSRQGHPAIVTYFLV